MVLDVVDVQTNVAEAVIRHVNIHVTENVPVNAILLAILHVDQDVSDALDVGHHVEVIVVVHARQHVEIHVQGAIVVLVLAEVHVMGIVVLDVVLDARDVLQHVQLDADQHVQDAQIHVLDTVIMLAMHHVILHVI